MIMIMVKMDVRIAGDIACVSARMESTDAKSAIGHLSLMTTCRLSGRGKAHQAFLVALTDAKKRTNLHNFCNVVFATQRQRWRGLGGLHKVHKKTHV